MYVCINNLSEANTFQEDPCKLAGAMGSGLEHEFNPTKCQVIHVTRLIPPITSKYFLHSINCCYTDGL